MQNSDKFLNHLESILATRASKSQLRKLTTLDSSPAHPLADFSSNDYLSLASDPVLHATFLAELASAKSTTLISPTRTTGSGGSRLLDGNSRYAEALEHDLARVHGAPAALLFGSGYDANVAVYTCIPQPGDVVVYDEYIHASVHDGMRASRAAKLYPFAHNCVKDVHVKRGKNKTRQLESLEQVLKKVDELHGPSTRVFVAIESVYSMDGDVAPLADIVSIIFERHNRSSYTMGPTYLIVDEAHATGVLGAPKGPALGLVNAESLESACLVRVHTFGKAVGAAGAVVLCPRVLREYLVNYARPFIYSTAPPLAALAAVRASYALLGASLQCAGITNLSATAVLAATRHDTLWARTTHLHTRLRALFPEPGPSPPSVPRIEYAAVGSDIPASSIFAVRCAGPADTRARALAAYCQARGFIVRAIVYPTVPRGMERVRVCVHEGNSVEEIEGLLACMCAWQELQSAREISAKL
ncbi:uncharacterized protein SAPINGB_P003961 [Magnusiomyces paraingens]|uniref:Aminotransferase class I/classII large domain-containing protein n=1 Tax=Magnusiomyces paraingens TaxID=2606893 RepID=A0A5E8BU97_9ASCO|nr:uncharacterized protein SAPINGB_P003961 [Saprochaete ingens]VVT54209.1 unnamed protein product [Saprochaete ingens]